MFKIATTLAAAAGVFAVASAAAAQPAGRPDLARYDARNAQTLAERLVLCDLASYFGTQPDLDAHRVYIQRDNYRLDATFPAAILRGGQWHDEDLERAYLRYRAAGAVEGDVSAVRQQYGTEMGRAFRQTTVGERRFFLSQSTFCRDLARGSWRAAAR